MVGTAAVTAAGFIAPPEGGRTYVTSRTVRNTEVTMSGRLRFDALARYLQEVAEDDMADTGLRLPHGWLVRRCQVSVRSYPARGDRVTLCTFCTGASSRLAARTTTISGPDGDMLQATGVWVAVEYATGSLSPVHPAFLDVYGSAIGDRQVSARLSHPAPDLAEAGHAGAGSTVRAWPLRASDFDPAGHANNSIHWAAVEDVLATLDWLPASAEVEYHRPMLPAYSPELITRQRDGDLYAWLMHGRQRLASARLAP